MSPCSSPRRRSSPTWAVVAAGLVTALGALGTLPVMAADTDPGSNAAATGAQDATAIAQIAKTLDLLHASAAKADGKTYFSLYAPDAVFIGTDVAERWTIAQFRAYAEPIFAKGQGWVYTVRKREVTVAPIACHCIAWFDEVLDSQKYGTSRGTGVLTHSAAGWKIEQYALTFPLPNDLAADITQRIRDHEKRAVK